MLNKEQEYIIINKLEEIRNEGQYINYVNVNQHLFYHQISEEFNTKLRELEIPPRSYLLLTMSYKIDVKKYGFDENQFLDRMEEYLFDELQINVHSVDEYIHSIDYYLPVLDSFSDQFHYEIEFNEITPDFVELDNLDDDTVALLIEVDIENTEWEDDEILDIIIEICPHYEERVNTLIEEGGSDEFSELKHVRLNDTPLNIADRYVEEAKARGIEHYIENQSYIYRIVQDGLLDYDIESPKADEYY